jgi:uncharacterized protein
VALEQPDSVMAEAAPNGATLSESSRIEPLSKPRGGARPVRRLLFVTTTTLALGYVAICVAIYVFQARLIYYPPGPSTLTPNEYRLEYEAVSLPTLGGATISAWYIPHASPHGTAIFSYGNAMCMAECLGTAKTLHRLGYSVLLFDYPGYGHSTGEPGEQATYDAAEAAWTYLTATRGLPARQIVIVGRSLGGAVAIELASHHEPAALVVECTFTSMVAMGQREYPFLPVSWLCRHRYDSIAKVGRIRCPKLFLHGTEDTLIPLAMAERLFDAAAEPKKFIPTAGGHNEAGFEYSVGYTRALGEWLGCALPPASQPAQTGSAPRRR